MAGSGTKDRREDRTVIFPTITLEVRQSAGGKLAASEKRTESPERASEEFSKFPIEEELKGLQILTHNPD